MSARDGRSGSTRRLIELCVGYFLSYVLTGIAVKWFTGGLREPGEPGMSDIAYLFNNTLGGNLLCLVAVFALLALAVHALLGPLVLALESRGVPAARALGLSAAGLKGGFDFLREPMALTIMGLYITAYAVRLHLMNYFKNTRDPGPQLDNRGFFAIEQIAATATIALVGAFFYHRGGLSPRRAAAPG
jgi:hypothetical protein